MTRWQRRARTLIALSAMVFAGGVYVTIRERPRPAGVPSAPPRADPAAVVESTGARLVQLLGGHERIRVEATRQLLYPDGRIRLDDGVRIALPSSGRGEVVVTGRQAEVRENQAVIDIEGDVRLTSDDGLRATAGRATYDHRSGVLEVPGPVDVRREALAVSGVGARFERGHDVLWIRQQAVIVLAGDSPSELVRVRAPAAVYARAERFWRFDGHVIFERADWTSEADAAVIHLDAEERRVTLVELRGGARVVARGHDPGSIETMSARDITLDYGADGRELGQALLAGRAAVRLRGAPGEATRRVAAEWMDVRLAPGVGRISHLTARDAVEVSLPGAGATPARRIRARALDVVGSADESLQTARFTGDVEFWETLRTPAGAGRGERLLRAQTLEARFAAALGELEDARFTGAVELRDGELRADAGAARYQVAAGLVELLPGTAPADPRVTDERVIVTARRIELDVATRRLIAEGTVRCELRPQPRPAAPAPAETPRLPQLLDHRRPAYATAARLAYDSQRAVAEFAGSATLFQDDTAIQGETVTLDERRGDLTAVGGVRSRTRFEQTDPEAKARERRDSVGTADRLEYDDALRRLRYLDKALLRDPDGQMRADRIDVYLRETAEAVDRIEAFGSVALRLDRRAAWGDRLTYVEREGRYVVHGTPVRIVEDLGTECRETLGRTLTFQKAADTITVDGNAEHRTRTKTGGKCPELRLQ